MNSNKLVSIMSPETIGVKAGEISVELSTRFLEHFSEQLYSSPQKAFEELISNGWDAGASCVDVRIAVDLNDPKATMCVLDNGGSMNEDGLRQLWHIAFSPKKDTPTVHGRHVIGKFGIGKLATYVLASKLTYLCKAADGKIRRVTMNYGAIDQQQGVVSDRLISDLKISLFEVTENEVSAALSCVYGGRDILNLINQGIPEPQGKLSIDEFGAPKSPTMPTSATWTLVILSDLKSTGRELKMGILRRMLEAALPFGSEMAISLNGELLTSSKSDVSLIKEWIIGQDLDIDEVEIEEDDDHEQAKRIIEKTNSEESIQKSIKLTKIPTCSGSDPVPHIQISGVGMITGRICLFAERISGGKSEERGASNGFKVNVLGRVVNQNDPTFGEQNLSHAVWSRFRMTVRADGLSDLITTDREKLKEHYKLKIFKAFLRRAFNKARTFYDSDQQANMPDGGNVLVRSLGVLSLNPLRNIVSETLLTKSPLLDLFDESGIEDRKTKQRLWQENTADNIRSTLSEVRFENAGDSGFVKFRISDSTIVVNKEHPFVAEHSRTKAEKDLLRTIAMVNLLTDVYALDLGIEAFALHNIREYRDRLMRFRAMESRQSGTYIAKLLLQTQHDSTNSKMLEAVISDALRYLGYQVRDLAKPGEPEGIASAYTTPSNSNSRPSLENPNPPLYSFSFDAKSSKHDVAATGNINLAGIVEHQQRYKADYALVVAPGYTPGALSTRCEQQKVTPIKASDLGRLLEYTVQHGAIPLTKLRDMFEIFDPDEVSTWVSDLELWLTNKQSLTIDVFIRALEKLKGKIPDVLPAATIALTCRESLNAISVLEDDVIALAKGLAILIPDIVGVEGDKIVVNTSSARVAAAVASQLERLHDNDLIMPNQDNEETK